MCIGNPLMGAANSALDTQFTSLAERVKDGRKVLKQIRDRKKGENKPSPSTDKAPPGTPGGTNINIYPRAGNGGSGTNPRTTNDQSDQRDWKKENTYAR